MNVSNLLDLYTDYLMVTPSNSSATRLSSVTDNQVSHDQITRLLSGTLDAMTLWREVKLMIRDMICPEGLLIIDDSIEPRKYRKSNSMITLHYDHCTGKSIKGVNFMNAFYYSPKHDMGIPIGVEFVTKDVEFKDDKGDIKKKSGRAKNEMIRSMAKYANYNGGTFYLASSDLNLDYPSLTTIYQKRWKVEGLFRSIKNNTAFAKAPTKTLKTQLAYFTASMIAFCILERLKVRNNKNQYAMKSQIWLAATKTAWKEPDRLSTNKTKFNKIAA